MAEVRVGGWRTLCAVAVVLLAIKLVMLVVAHPFMDETYYFMWGQHPALSYFDHPPLVGWTEGLAAALFGWSIIGLRAMVALTLMGDLVLLYLFARHLAGEDWRRHFWLSAVLLSATPIFFALTSVALPDHLLMFFSLLAVYGFERFRAAFEAGETRWGWLYLTATAIGFAVLSKYTGALLAVGALGYVIARPSLRPVLRASHFYLATALIVVMQAPVIVWNLQHGLASVGFIFGGRAALRDLSSFAGLGGFALGAVAILSPILLVPMAKFLFAGRDGHGVARIIFWVSTIGFLVASVFTNILIHWNAVAYIVLLPFLALYLRSRILIGLQVVYGMLAIAFAAVNYTAGPVMALISFADQTSAWSYGWDEVASEIAALRQSEPIGFVAATDYALASPLAFALQDAHGDQSVAASARPMMIGSMLRHMRGRRP